TSDVEGRGWHRRLWPPENRMSGREQDQRATDPGPFDCLASAWVQNARRPGLRPLDAEARKMWPNGRMPGRVRCNLAYDKILGQRTIRPNGPASWPNGRMVGRTAVGWSPRPKGSSQTSDQPWPLIDLKAIRLVPVKE